VGTDADVEPCAALALLAAPEIGAAKWREALARDIEDAERHLVVAERGGELAGYGRAPVFEPGADAPDDTAPRGYCLTGVFVRPEDRRNGVGAALTKPRLDWIGERVATAWCFANARNTASIELHRKLGFEEVSRSFSFPGVTLEGGVGILFRLEFSKGAAVA
jgi:ribosomal protein S18 acetylase RimI-like enzyme